MEPDTSFWIIGAGKFGTKALQKLIRRWPEAFFRVVDRNPKALKVLEQYPVDAVRGEGAAYLARHLDGSEDADWIVPAVPMHLAFEWVKIKMMEDRTVEIVAVPEEVERVLPNPVRGNEGQLFLSYADFVCPDNCSEPFDRCTFTGKPRKGLLYRDLENRVVKEFLPVIIRSRQLAPSVGGYQSKALWEALKKVKAHHGLLLFGTACFCHGVVHALRVP
jgi:hypothetical protein